jgi:hypothetical protein
MKSCPRCDQQNQDDSNFCYQCGAGLRPSAEAAVHQSSSLEPTSIADRDVWREFIGPNADRYLAQFKKFGPERAPRFALSWNWPAFLFISFLWFLYRKMYLYAMVYAVGPMISTYLTGDVTVGIVWSIMAGATGNYIYYWHCRERIGEITRAGGDQAKQDQALREAGGVQPYVIWVGVVFYLLFTMLMVKMIQEGLSDSQPRKPGHQTVMKSA